MIAIIVGMLAVALLAVTLQDAFEVMLPLPGWSTDRKAQDHWTRGPRGTLARRLIDELSGEKGEKTAPAATSAPATRWRRLRARLRLD